MTIGRIHQHFSKTYCKLKIQQIFPGQSAVKLFTVKLFSDKTICPKSTQTKPSQREVDEAKTIENIKHEPVLSYLLF